jgi:inhibitor of KinA
LSEFELQYKPFGERSILIEWPQIISNNVLNHVLTYKRNLENYDFEEIVYIKSAYNSILITYTSTINNFYDKVLALKSLNNDVNSSSGNNFKLWKIHVCYDLDLGIDLEEISNENNIEISDLIKRHSKAMYQIYFIGFLPGFLYLGGLDKKLHFPRKPTPRLKVEKGSVGIGGSQTGIYPNDSPGGWNIIGKTPINFFDVNNKEPCFAKPGDKIQFVSISREEFNQITIQVDKMAYRIESEVLND